MNRTIAQCATLLHQARTRQFALHEIPPPYRPASIEDAYRCQRELANKLLASDGRRRKVIGYKAGNTNDTSQQFLRLPEPFYGPLIADDELVGLVGTRAKPAVVRSLSKKMRLRLCEPEFALLVGSDGAIEAVAPAIELVHTSFMNWKTVGAPSLIADLACNGGWIRGEPVPIAQAKLESCILRVNGKEIAIGSADKVMGSPLKVFEMLKRQPMFNVKPGDWISTGVCVDPPYHYCEDGDLIEVEFGGGVGSVAVKCDK